MSQFDDVTIGAGTAYSTAADELSPAFSGVRISRSLRVSGIDCASLRFSLWILQMCEQFGVFDFPFQCELSKFQMPPV